MSGMHWIEQLREIARDGGHGWQLIAADLLEENGAGEIALWLREERCDESLWQRRIITLGKFIHFSNSPQHKGWNRIVDEYTGGHVRKGDIVEGPFGFPHQIGSWDA